MDALCHLRDMIASLDAPLVDDLCARARLRRSESLYAPNGAAPPGLAELAGQYAVSTSLPGRVLLLRAAYVHRFLPVLCEPGDDDRAACLAADTACLNALARRLALSVHVATRKREAIPPALQEALRSRDPVRVEQAITHPAVEADVLDRVDRRARQKAPRPDVPARIAALYAEWLIPLSRKIQVHGLLADA